MKLEKAIDTLNGLKAVQEKNGMPPHVDAIKLGIEALKKLKANREYGPMAGTGLLPGETKD